MSDLISREEALKLKFRFEVKDEFYMTKEIEMVEAKDIESIPSADIMECARAIKEYCKKNLKTPHFWCEGCPLYEVMCQPVLSIPSMWDLPEGEKKSPIFIDSAPLKDCKNKAESYGEICVRCNKCGRFGKEKE